MNEQAEHFRRITMKVLTMQLNSITIMDLVAFGGSAAGIILAVRAYAASEISFCRMSVNDSSFRRNFFFRCVCWAPFSILR